MELERENKTICDGQRTIFDLFSLPEPGPWHPEHTHTHTHTPHTHTTHTHRARLRRVSQLTKTASCSKDGAGAPTPAASGSLCGAVDMTLIDVRLCVAAST